ncbi:MAG: hypothetical protein AAFR36_04675 [Bacteroidota bacterium]
MNSEILFEYSPESTDRLFLWLGILVALGAFALTYFFLSKKRTGRAHTQDVLVAMLFFFLGLLATGTAFFSGWSLLRQGKVVLQAEQLQIGNNTILYSDINKIYYKRDKQASVFQAVEGTTTINFLVVEAKGGRTYPLSEQQYPIGEIRSRLEEIFTAQKEE